MREHEIHSKTNEHLTFNSVTRQPDGRPVGQHDGEDAFAPASSANNSAINDGRQSFVSYKNRSPFRVGSKFVWGQWAGLLRPNCIPLNVVAIGFDLPIRLA